MQIMTTEEFASLQVGDAIIDENGGQWDVIRPNSSQPNEYPKITFNNGQTEEIIEHDGGNLSNEEGFMMNHLNCEGSQIIRKKN